MLSSPNCLPIFDLCFQFFSSVFLSVYKQTEILFVFRISNNLCIIVIFLVLAATLLRDEKRKNIKYARFNISISFKTTKCEFKDYPAVL